MTDLQKNPADNEVIQSELVRLVADNQKLNGEIELVRGKLKDELDTLSYRLDTLNRETKEIRQEVYDLGRTIEKMRYDLVEAVRAASPRQEIYETNGTIRDLRHDLLSAIRENKRSEISDLISNAMPLFAVTVPSVFLLIAVIVKTLR